MVKITLEYQSVEEAIQALGKLSGLAKVRRAATATTTGAVPSAPSTEAADIPQGSVTAPAPTRQRKPRNDAGKPRGPHKKVAAGAEGNAPLADTPVQSAPPPFESAAGPSAETAPAAASPSEAAPASSAPAEADAKAALEAYFEKHGPQKAMALLASFGVSKLRELPEGDRAKFIEDCKK